MSAALKTLDKRTALAALRSAAHHASTYFSPVFQATPPLTFLIETHSRAGQYAPDCFDNAIHITVHTFYQVSRTRNALAVVLPRAQATRAVLDPLYYQLVVWNSWWHLLPLNFVSVWRWSCSYSNRNICPEPKESGFVARHWSQILLLQDVSGSRIDGFPRRWRPRSKDE